MLTFEISPHTTWYYFEGTENSRGDVLMSTPDTVTHIAYLPAADGMKDKA